MKVSRNADGLTVSDMDAGEAILLCRALACYRECLDEARKRALVENSEAIGYLTMTSRLMRELGEATDWRYLD